MAAIREETRLLCLLCALGFTEFPGGIKVLALGYESPQYLSDRLFIREGGKEVESQTGIKKQLDSIQIHPNLGDEGYGEGDG
ncbi:unnamed protein product [Lota lota]